MKDRRQCLLTSLLSLAVLFCFAGLSLAQGTKNAIKDPHGFEAAAQMYEVAPMKEFDKTAEALLNQVAHQIKSGNTPEQKAVWDNLVKLNPYRRTTEVQAAVEEWAVQSAERLKRVNGTAEMLGFANSLYIDGKFKEASESYRSLVGARPGNLDARNNLALSEMHLGNDLTAQLELEITTRLSTECTAAKVNLSVIYERLGLREKAKKTAEEAYQSGSEVPAAAFNAAWFSNFEGQYEKADAILRPISAGAGSLHQQFLEVNEKQLEASGGGPILLTDPRFGLVAVWVAAKLPYGRTGATAVFVILTIIIILIASSLGRRASYSNRGRRAFWWFFFLGGLFFLLSWGVPFGWRWGLPLLYVLLCGRLASRRAIQ